MYKDNPIFQLQGPGGVRPKAPAVGAWQSPGYAGISMDDVRREHDCWYGMRCDGLVVIDCDDVAAARHWTGIDTEATVGWVRKTPRGFHFIYEWTEGSPEGPSVGVFEHTDIRAGRTSQIVAYAPGYKDLNEGTPRLFDPRWLPAGFGNAQVTHEDESWSEMPDGRGNNTMAALGGAMRKQGMDVVTIVKCLSAINRITMTQDPMSQAEVIEIARSVGRYAPRPDIDIELDE